MEAEVKWLNTEIWFLLSQALGHIMPYEGTNFVPEALNEIEKTLKHLLEESKHRGLPGVTLKDLQDALWSNRRLLNYTEATIERALVKLRKYQPYLGVSSIFSIWIPFHQCAFFVSSHSQLSSYSRRLYHSFSFQWPRLKCWHCSKRLTYLSRSTEWDSTSKFQCKGEQ